MDLEERGHSEHPEQLRLWLRLLTLTQMVGKQVRTQLREQFDTTLPRFDLMAQLERNPAGLKVNELSRRTGGHGRQCHGHHRPADGLQWTFFNSLHEPEALPDAALKLAHALASGPTFAHAMTMLHQK